MKTKKIITKRIHHIKKANGKYELDVSEEVELDVPINEPQTLEERIKELEAKIEILLNKDE